MTKCIYSLESNNSLPLFGQKDKYPKHVAWLAMCFGSFAFGLALTLIGPTLLDLEEILSANDLQVSYGYAARSFMYCLGALLCK